MNAPTTQTPEVHLSAPFNHEGIMRLLFSESTSHAEILRKLGKQTTRPRYHEQLREVQRRWGLILHREMVEAVSDGGPLGLSGKFTGDDAIRVAVEGARSYTEAVRRLGASTTVSNYVRLALRCKELGLTPPPQDKRGKGRDYAAMGGAGRSPRVTLPPGLS